MNHNGQLVIYHDTKIPNGSQIYKCGGIELYTYLWWYGRIAWTYNELSHGQI